jgi:amino acid adenylation domain-containing protein
MTTQLGTTQVRTTQLIHEYLLAHATSEPDRPAVVSGRGTMTYGELAATVGRYADQFDAHGVRAGDVVVFEFDPRPAPVALIIAAASRGIVFVNVSPHLPVARKEHILAEVEAVAHVGPAPSRNAAAEPPGAGRWQPAVRGWLDGGELRLTGRAPAAAQPREAVAPDLAYVVFTSGSTGRPKGIMMSHRAVVSFWRGFCGFGVRPGVRLGSTSPLQFDFSLLDLGMALGAGGTLVQVPSVLAHQPSGFVRALRDHGVEQMNGVPSIWRELVASEHLAELRQTRLDTVVYAGEGFPAPGLRALRAAHPALRIVNGFGHSESIACAYQVLGDPLTDEHGRAPFGTRAIDGMRMYLVDDDGRIIDRPGAVGELYVEGDALFDGYWRDEAATAAALVRSPLSGPGTLAFRSRDQVYRDAAGQHYFHSRKDDQIKLLGNRIELEEIDLHLQNHPAVSQAAAALDQSGNPRIVAFVHVRPDRAGGTQLIAELREHCNRELPRYMVPASFEFVPAIPVTANGKVDRAALLNRGGAA